MSELRPVSSKDMERAVAEAFTHAEGSKLAALAYDVLSTQAEGGSLFAGQKFMAQRAEKHGVTRPMASTGLGNLQSILEKGPQANVEWALVAAFAIRGFGEQLVQSSRSERAEHVDAFVAQLDWLEVCSHYRVYPMIERLLDRFSVDAVYRAVANAVLREDADSDAAARARNAARLTALVEAGAEGAREALAHVVEHASDPFTAAMVATAMGGPAPGPTAPGSVPAPELFRLQGVAARVPTGSFWTALRVLSGWALISWVGRGLSALCGLRRSVTVELGDRSLRVTRSAWLLGRELSTRDETHRLEQVTAIRRHARYPAVHLLVGAVSFSLGLFVGGLFLFDAVRIGQVSLVALGGGLLLGGSALDLLLSVVLPARRGQVALDVGLDGGQRVRLTGLAQADADRFAHALAQRVDARMGQC